MHRRCANEKEKCISLWGDQNVQSTSNSKTITQLIQELREYHKTAKREEYDAYDPNYLIKYWKNKDQPEILEISRMVSLISPTQATVERTFSVVKFIF